MIAVCGAASGAGAQTAPADLDLAAAAVARAVRQAAAAHEAEPLLAAAREALAEGRYVEAAQMAHQAAAVDPANVAAQAVADHPNTLLTGRTAGGLLQREVENIAILQQVYRSRIEGALREAQEATVAGDFLRAQRAIDQARAALEARPDLWSRAEAGAYQNTLARQESALARHRDELSRQDATRASADLAATSARREQQEQAERQRTVRMLEERARQLVSDQQYEKALGVIHQIEALDPNNRYTAGNRQLVSDRMILQDQRQVAEAVDRNVERQVTEAQERKIPYVPIIAYPANWTEITERRERQVAEQLTPLPGGGQ
jgi:tetratricopeptide (TPR) repeat protein